MVENAFASLESIIVRIQHEVPEFRAVMAAPDLAAVLENQQQSPSAHVIYGGYQVGGDRSHSGNRTTQVIVQRWPVVIAVKNAGEQIRKTEVMRTGGELFVKVFRALAGFQAADGAKPLRLVAAPMVPIYSAAFVYIPLAFEAELILTQE